MAIATRIDSFVAPTITQLTLYDGIKAAFTNAGYSTPFDDYTSGTDRVLVYAVVLDATKTYGTTYLRLRITTGLIIAQQLFATWNTSTKTGLGASVEIVFTTFVSNAQVNFTALNGGSELKIVMAGQGTLVLPLGFISPANKPVWWDLNAWNYCFISLGSVFTNLRCTAFNPYANSDFDSSLGLARMGIANNQTNRRDVLPGLILYTQTNQGIAGRTTDDLVSVAGTGTTRYDVLQIPNDPKQYLLLNPVSGGLAVRIA